MDERLPQEGGKIREVAPELAKETDEQVTDDFIDEMLLHRDIDHDRLDALRERSTDCAERVHKLEKVFPQIDEFLVLVEDRFPDASAENLPEGVTEVNGDRIRIRDALALMLKVHINQADRVATDEPFIAHPLAVATEVLDTHDGEVLPQVVIAALLHDSIEDQSRLLSLEKKMMPEAKATMLRSSKQKERDEALHGIGLLFGLHTQLLVNSLTSPAAIKTGIIQRDKNWIYLDYVRNIFSPDAVSTASAVIKWADLQQNAFIGDLYEKAERMRKENNVEEFERAMGMYLKLKSKYKPVLGIVREFFETVEEGHPLYSQREEAIAKIDDALENQYTLA